MKILKHCLLLGTVICIPLAVEAAAIPEPVEIVHQGRLLAPLSPSHIELFKLAEDGDADAKETFFQRFMNGAVSLAFREEFVVSKLLPQTDDLTTLSEAALYVAAREWKTIPDSFVKFIGSKAEEGNTNAQGIMGFLYASGKGVLENQDEGAKWFRRAIESGNSGVAYSNLAYAIKNKDVVGLANEKFEKLAEQAMQNGFVGAIIFEKLMSQEKYLLQAAQAGRSEAEEKLGMHFRKKNREKEAYSFLMSAFEQGEYFSVDSLDYLVNEA